MGKTLLFLMLFLSNIALAQFQDNFSDGDFTANPAWTGSTTSFLIGNGQLQSNGPQLTSTLYLSTANTLAHKVTFEFLLNLAFDPSTTNYPRIYLLSNRQDLSITTGLQGYYLQLGSSTSAENFTLVRQNGATNTTILTLADKARPSANAVNVRVKVERDENGRWDIYTDFNGGNSPTYDGSVTDNTYTTSTHFGVYCRYSTASRYNGFSFGDFKVGVTPPDLVPPALNSVKTIDDTNIEATFSKPLTATEALVASNYSLSTIGNPTNVTAVTAGIYRLTYATAISSGNYTLTVNNVKDLKGNIIANNNTANFLHIKTYVAKKGDIVINEILADPSNSKGMPTTEFIELWNTSTEYISLRGWKYSDPSSTANIGDEFIAPNSYVILCPTSAVATYQTYGKTIGLSPWPTLNNDKDYIKLVNQDGTLIDDVAYTDNWYKDTSKKSGGYSLELIDPKNKCTGIQNWMASNSTIGGTPGIRNSVYQSQVSTTAPKVLSVSIVDANTVRVEFSKYVDSASAAIAGNYSFNNGIGQAVMATPISPAFTAVELKFTNAMARGIENALTVTNLTDCAGNLIDPASNTAKTFWAKEIGKNEILISEILFNPKTGGVDFVEIYNSTDHVLDLKDLQLANADANGKPASFRTLSANSIFIQPKSYWVITSKTDVVQQHYEVKYPSQMVQIATLPSYNNDKGTAIILSNAIEIDRFSYTEKMHLALLKDFKGVSLERVSFIKPTAEAGNFRSAAQSVGFATPTYKNSQSEDESIIKNDVMLAIRTFSPDNDGFDDVLKIDYQFKEIGNLATVNIYTDKGVLVKKLQRNTSIGTNGSFTWDGLDDNGQLGRIGVYVIKFDVFTLNGRKESFTKTCVLAAKLL